MTEEKTGENQGNPTSPIRRERVAVCLVCNDEWTARNGNAKKPSKCPTCGTKRCAWKDEMPAEPEKRTETQQKRTETHEEDRKNEGEEKEKKGEIEEKNPEEKREKKRENATSSVKSTITPNEEKGGNGEKKPEEKNAPGGFPVVLVVAGLVVLGTLAGVGWFLGRRQPVGPRTPTPIYRPPTAAERAMIRVGGT